MSDAGQGDAATDFSAYWLQREPGMRLALGFLPSASRDTWSVWGALLLQWRESLFELSTPELRLAKSGWWAQECWGRTRGLSRHPLTQALPEDLPWQALADGLEHAAADVERVGEWREHRAALMALAAAVAGAESKLSGVPITDHADDLVNESLIAHWLLHRLPAGLAKPDRAGIPLDYLARHPQAALQDGSALQSSLIRDWAGHIETNTPARVEACRFRRQRHALDRILLQRLVAGQGFVEPAGFGTLFTLWNNARHAPA